MLLKLSSFNTFFYIHVLAFAYALIFPLLSLCVLLFQYKCKGKLWRSCDEKVGPQR